MTQEGSPMPGDNQRLSFNPGDRVRCVDARPSRLRPELVHGNVYTVREVSDDGGMMSLEGLGHYRAYWRFELVTDEPERVPATAERLLEETRLQGHWMSWASEDQAADVLEGLRSAGWEVLMPAAPEPRPRYEVRENRFLLGYEDRWYVLDTNDDGKRMTGYTHEEDARRVVDRLNEYEKRLEAAETQRQRLHGDAA